MNRGLTEDEAKTKRCPQSFPAASGLSSHGHAYPGVAPGAVQQGVGFAAVQTAPTQCIASTCMAWRWQGWADDRSGHVYPAERNGFDRVGYCGLAGTP